MSRPWLTLALVAAALLAWLLPGHGAALGWELGAVPWRLLTSQLSHWDGNHLLWDAAAVLVLGCWAERCWPVTARIAVILAVILIPSLVTLVHPDLAFRGLSGIACALAGVAVISTWRASLRDRDLPAAGVAALMLFGLLAKLTYEAVAGRAVFANAVDWQPLPIAHAIGLLTGWIACLRRPDHPSIPALTT